MGMEDRDLTQHAVLWEATAEDRYGDVKLGAATPIRVRWETKRQEITDEDGRVVALSARVVVDRDLTVGSILWLGKVDDLPSTPTDLNRVAVFEKVPDVKGRHFRRTALVERWSDSLPELA